MIQEEVLKELREKIGVGDFNLPIFCDKPIIFGSKQKQLFQNQHLLIKNFFNTVVLIAKKALYDENDNILKKFYFLNLCLVLINISIKRIVSFVGIYH